MAPTLLGTAVGLRFGQEAAKTVARPSDIGLGDPPERRNHRRIEIRLPVECRGLGEPGVETVRAVTRNVCTGGMMVDLDRADYRPGDRLNVELTIPPAEGVAARPGLATCAGEVVRLEPSQTVDPGGWPRVGLAIRFLDKLRISY